ncbi:MAG TPA: hypothetical protein VGM73_14870 [Candidatus Didemnitutus sp.]|jgi:hypothetical protein
MFFKSARRGLLLEFNPHRILVAGVAAWQSEPILIDGLAEFDARDIDGFRSWLQSTHDRSLVPAYCSFAPRDWQLVRDSVVPRRLVDPGYLADLAREKMKLSEPELWQLNLMHPSEGEEISAEGAQRPALISAVSHSSIRETQQMLLDLGILPYRLEVGILPLIGAVINYNEQRQDTRAAVIIEVQETQTTAWILGKEGVHTPTPIKVGYNTIERTALKEFSLANEAEVHERLMVVEEELLLRANRLVRLLVRELKPVFDSFEMTTGQRAGELYCAYLPPWLSWLNEPLAIGTGLEPFAIDCNSWLGTVGLTAAPDVQFPPNYFSLLALVARLGAPKTNGVQ